MQAAKDIPKGNVKNKAGLKSALEDKPPPPINIQNFIDKKLQPTKRIEIPASDKFPNAENDANNWSISVMAKYLKEKLELPQYAESFKRQEIDGLKFISMNESNFVASEVTNKFHAMKLASHAELLRELVLEKAHIDRPDSEADWSVAHVAAWLTYDKCCPETALHTLKAKLNGYKLKDLSGKQAVSAVGAADLPEAESAVLALDGLAQKVIAACAKEDEKNHKPETTAAVDDSIDVAGSDAEAGLKLKKKKKTKTAIQKRREKQQQEGAAGEPKEPQSTHEVSDDSESELHIIRNDSLPVPQKKKEKGSASDAFSSAMSNIFADVQATAPVPTPAAIQTVPTTDVPAIDENAYGKVRGSTTVSGTDRSTSMKPTRGARAVSGNQTEDLERELMDAKFEEMQRGDQEDPDFFRMEGYKKSKERKKFMSKITSLRKIVAEHAQNMHELREQAHILKSENLMIKEQQKMLLKEGGASQELIATLVHDRNVALSELEKVVSLYDEHTSREREEVVRDLRSLARDTYKAKSETEEIWRSRAQQMAQVGNLDVSVDALSPQKPVGKAAITMHRSKKERKQRNGDSDSSGSDLDDEFDHKARTAPHPAPVRVSASAPVSTLPISAAVPALAASGPTLTSHALSTPAPRVYLTIDAPTTPAAATQPPSAPSSIQKGASHPLAVARTLLASTGATATSASPAPAAGSPPIDLMRMVDRTADASLALWQGILRTYRVPRAARVEHYSDNKLILRNISVPWQRLGHRMLEDAHTSENEEVRKALKGLEKCAKKAVLGATRAAKRALESTADTLKSTSHASNTKPAQAQNTTLKKSVRSELSSTAFPVDDATALAGEGGAGSSTEEVNCHHRATGMVFGLALVLRIMNRYSAEGEDKTQLLYLLNKVNHGELPVTEISRDNMRDFLDSHIGIDLKWDKFDSVCQKLDPDRNGFIFTPSVVLAFSQLTPLSDRAFVSGLSAAGGTLSSGFDAEFGELVLLSIATDTMAKPRQAVGEAFMSLILHNAKSSASFAKFVQKEQDRVGLEDKGYVPDAVSPRSAKTTPDARVAEQQLFATDIFYELTKEFVYKAEAMPDLESRKLPKSSKQDLKESQKLFLTQKKHMSFLLQQHQEACGAVARGVQVYAGGSRKALVDHLSTFVLTFLSFRRKVVTSMLESARGEADPLGHGAPKLSVEQLQQLLLSIETNIATLTGLYKPHEENDPSSDHYSPIKPKSKGPGAVKLAPDMLTLQEYDLIIAELLGIPLPKYTHCDAHSSAGCCTGLARIQAQVETVLFTINQHFALEEKLMVAPPEPPKPLASSLALKDLQQTLFKELWQGEAPTDETPGGEEEDGALEHAVSPAKSLRAAHHMEGPPMHVVEEVNARMHQQRVEQATHYLEILNDKAVKRKKTIRGLMNLWQAAKMAVTDNNKISKFASASEIEHKRQIALPVEDILLQTKLIQTRLVADMQEKSTTKLSQLSQRINLLRQGVASQSIPDEDLAVTAQLREISLLENALLQANADAMRLAARIVQQLTSKKENAEGARTDSF